MVKVPVVFRTNRLSLWTVDLTSRILSSVPPKYVQGPEMEFIGKNIHLSVCWHGFMAMCWHKGNLLSFMWRWVGYDVSRLLLLSYREKLWKPQFLQITSNGPQTAYRHTQVITAVSDLYFCCLNQHILIITQRSNVLPYNVLYNHEPPWIPSQCKSVLGDKFKAWAACATTF